MYNSLSTSRARFQILLHTSPPYPTPLPVRERQSCLWSIQHDSLVGSIRPTEQRLGLDRKDAWEIEAIDAQVMASSIVKILISRRNNFPPIARYLTDNSSTRFKVGDEVKVRRFVTVEDVNAFAQLTGDTNPIHLDEHFAKKTELGRLVVHGVILNGYRNLINLKFINLHY